MNDIWTGYFLWMCKGVHKKNIAKIHPKSATKHETFYEESNICPDVLRHGERMERVTYYNKTVCMPNVIFLNSIIHYL